MPGQAFGFITGDDGAVFFCHRSALRATDFGERASGMRVEFAAEPDAQVDPPSEHPHAVGVHLAPGARPAAGNEALSPAITGSV